MGSAVSRHQIVSVWDTFANKLTTINTYVDVGTWHIPLLQTKHLYFTATTNDLNVTILASLDGGVTYPITAEAEFAVATGSPVSKMITVYYTDLKVQVKPAVNDTHGTLSTQYAGSSL